MRPTSADTVLRLIRRLPLPEVEVPRVVAVDDGALCKGRTYGAIVVALERRRVADLLPDRTSPTVAANCGGMAAAAARGGGGRARPLDGVVNGPRASLSASRAARVRAWLILFCPTWGGWPKGVRAALFCGASCAA